MNTPSMGANAQNSNNSKIQTSVAFSESDLVYLLRQRGYRVIPADEKDPLPEQSVDSPARAKPEQETPAPAKTNFGVCTTANAFSVLWDRTADTLNDNELRWFSNLAGQAALDAGNLSAKLAALACIISDDEASAPSDDTLADIIFGLSDRAKIISVTLNVANEATSRLKHPELYDRDSASAATQGGAV